MPSAAFLLLLGLIGTVSSNPVCPTNCKLTNRFETQYFKHVSDLGTSSIAPWSLVTRKADGEHLKEVPYAECQSCSGKNMTAKPIYFQISIFKRVHNGTGHGHGWCRCPYDLSVGCTCVKKE